MIARTPEEVIDQIAGVNGNNCTVFIRNATPVRGRGTSTVWTNLSVEGIQECQVLSPIYLDLQARLIDTFGRPVFRHGGLPKHELTAWELFHPDQVDEDERIRQMISLHWIEKDCWWKRHRSRGLNWMLNAAADAAELFRDQPLQQALTTAGSFLISGFEDSHLTIGVGNEPAVTLWLLMYALVEPDLAGLDYCQAYVVISDLDNPWIQSVADVTQVIKFCPELPE